MTLTLAPGSFHFLIGPSGAGKTTLLRLCYMDLVADRGAHPLLRPRRSRRVIANAIADLRRAVGVVHQDCRFLDHLPLIENIALPLRVSGIDGGGPGRRPRGAARMGRPRRPGRGAAGRSSRAASGSGRRWRGR